MTPSDPYAVMLNCDGCRGTAGMAGCPTHGHTWASSQPVVTHCPHGLDLRVHPRCYLCSPSDAEARAALLAELAAGVRTMPGLVAAGDDGHLIYGVAVSRAAVLDLIRKAGEG